LGRTKPSNGLLAASGLDIAGLRDTAILLSI